MEEDEKIQGASSNAAASQTGSWWESWGQTWIDTVKEKSAHTLEMVKKDLNEFVDVIQGDTSTVISETADKIEETAKEVQDDEVDSEKNSTKQVVKKGMEGLSKLLHSVSELMAIDPDDTQEEFVTLSDDGLFKSYDRKQEKLHYIQTDPGTYCNEPEGLYAEWLDIFALDDHKTTMSDLLAQNPAVRGIYTQLVPTVVSHTTFWQRYFYQIFLLDAEERKREELLARANNTISKDDDGDDGWGDDDDDIEVLSKPIGIAKINETLASKPIEEYSEAQPEYSIVEIEKNSSKTENYLNKDESQETNLTIPEHDSQSQIEAEIVVEPTGFSLSQARENPPVTNYISKAEDDKNVNIVDEKFQSTTMKNSISTVTAETPIDDTEINADKTKDGIDGKDSKNLTNSFDINKSFDTIQTGSETEVEFKMNENQNSPTIDLSRSSNNSRLQFIQDLDNKLECSETSSVSSWISIGEDMKVKKIKGEQEIKQDTNGSSEGKSSNGSSEVFINKSDADGSDDEGDFDLDLDEDVNEEELAKMVEDIKNKSAAGTLQDDDDDDDWENWE